MRCRAASVLGFEQDTLVPYRAPEEDERLAIEPSALAGQRIQLFTCTDIYRAYQICAHILLFFLSAPKTARGFTGDARVETTRRLTPRFEEPATCSELKSFPVKGEMAHFQAQHTAPFPMRLIESRT